MKINGYLDGKINQLKYIILLTHISILLANSNKPQQHEIWWQQNLNTQTMLNTFQNWLGNCDAASRCKARTHIMKHGYKSILDAGCGLCTELDGYAKANYPIEYIGIDITKRLVEMAKEQGINCLHASIEAIPLTDNQVDIVYIRHILEHLSYYQQALQEAIRCASKEVLVIFFMPPDNNPEAISYEKDNGYYLYHNKYNLNSLEAFIKNNKKVDHIFGEKVSSSETILHIMLKHSTQ